MALMWTAWIPWGPHPAHKSLDKETFVHMPTKPAPRSPKKSEEKKQKTIATQEGERVSSKTNRPRGVRITGTRGGPDHWDERGSGLVGRDTLGVGYPLILLKSYVLNSENNLLTPGLRCSPRNVRAMHAVRS